MRRQAASGSARPLLGLLSVHQCRAADRRADPVQVETLTPQQVHRVCTADTLSALASDPHTVGADPAGLAWSALCCIAWHRSIHRRPLIYLIIIGGCAELYSVRCCGCIWYRWRASGRVCALQRGTGGIIAACAGLVFVAVECDKSQKKPL